MDEELMSAVEPVENPPPAAVTAPPPTPAAPAPATRGRQAQLKQLVRSVTARAVPVLLYQMNRVGRSGMAGSALILFAAVFFCAAVLPQYGQISALRTEILQAQTQAGPDASPHVRLNRFLDNLPKRSELPAIAGKIFSLAVVAGVTLDRGRYELAPLHSGHVARYRMTFPIKGRYPAIRHFIDATLLTVPSAALEGLRIERKSVGDDNVEAELGFSVFVRNES
jgi:hypothetical protein